MLTRLCILALTVFAVGAALAPVVATPAAACSHHEKYDGA
jgi:hypothetical protein